MSSLTLYDGSIVLMQRGMCTLSNLLKKASEHEDATSFPSARLYEDMKPLSFQVWTASNTAKKTVKELTGAETETWEHKETTLDQLIVQCEKTIVLLKGVDINQVEGKDTVMVELSLGPAGIRQLTGKEFVMSYAVPNFFFHLQTAYAILRMKGVPIGKADFLGPFMVQDV
ncbi:hypothetical protein ColLi_11225 [Colletotrichum liriopes]|uniref:Helix-turn-helix-domain containing protein type n=1 Tax=Colletotrichum liriopes TaxID=708192 RepID=A0AA37GWM5_9PEZI|nr:hypothetical protein ColLi_11225 [Colletotrichum liriopes]